MVELHRVHASALCLRTEVCRITEHLGERHIASYYGCAVLDVGTFDPSASRAYITDDIAHMVIRHSDLYLEDRLEQYRLRLHDGFLEGL